MSESSKSHLQPSRDSRGEYYTSITLIGGKSIGPGRIDREDNAYIWIETESLGLMTQHGAVIKTEHQIPIDNILFIRNEYVSLIQDTEDNDNDDE